MECPNFQRIMFHSPGAMSYETVRGFYLGRTDSLFKKLKKDIA